jgi:hypothetical protein
MNSPQLIQSSDELERKDLKGNNKSDGPKKASWNEKLKKIVVEILLDLHKSGNFTDNSYKNGDWNKIVNLFHEKSGLDYSQQQISSYISSLKADWMTYSKIKDFSGFGWNEGKQTVSAPDDVWTALIVSNSKYAKFRKGFSCSEDISEIFDGKYATGKYAISAKSFSSNKKSRFDDNNSQRSNFSSDDEKYVEDDDNDISEEKVHGGVVGSSVKSGVGSSAKSVASNSSKKCRVDDNNRQRSNFSSDDDDNKISEDDEKYQILNKNRVRKVKEDPTRDLMKTLDRLCDGIAFPRAQVLPTDVIKEASELFTKKYAANLDTDATLSLKEYWYENPNQASLFMACNDNERIEYVRRKVGGM